MKKQDIPKPASLADIEKRYKDVLPSYQHSVLGFLMWGGKEFYLLDDNKPRNLNCTYNGWVYADEKKKLIQEYAFNNDKRMGMEHFVGAKAEEYYPWYYSSKKLPVSFQLARIIPSGEVNRVYDIIDLNNPENSLERLGIVVGNILYSLGMCFEYPEFFKPIYE